VVLVLVMVLLLQLLLIFYWVLLAEVRMMGPGSKRWSVFLLPNETIFFMSIFCFFLAPKKTMCVFNNNNNNNSRAIVLLLSCKFYLFLQQPISSKVHDDLETKWDPNFFFENYHVLGCENWRWFWYCRVLVSI
jgi:hypothetical protein